MIDFLVIGGGLAGVSAAARLSALGSVVLLERESALGYHASGRSAALFEGNYGKPSTIALNMASHDFHKTANGGVLSPRGLLLIGTDSDADAFEADRKYMKLDQLTPNEARAKIPIIDTAKVTHAAYHADAWDIDTDRLLQNFARAARDNGAKIIPSNPVTAISRTQHGWDVTAGDIYSAKTIINAAGAWVDEIATLAGITPLGFTPLRRSMGRIPAPGGHDVTGWPMMFGPGENWYAKPDAGALLVSPADEDPVAPHDAFADDMVLAEGFARYEAHVTEPVTRLLSSWAGLRTFAPDRQLVLGPSPQDAGFVWCAGQGGYGIQTSPAASQLIADLVAGTPPAIDADVVKMLSPARFG